MRAAVRQLLARFAHENGGAVIPLAAVLLTSTIGFIGTALDYSRAATLRTAMQQALDSTALMLSKEAQTLGPEQIAARANDYFAANFTRVEARNLHVEAIFTSPQPGSFAVRVTADATIDTAFMNIFGKPNVVVGTSSEVVWGTKKLELALVLDNTGSMGGSGKLAALKQSSHNLIDTLRDAARQPGDVKIAIVPFDVRVNLGAARAGEPWLDFATNGVDPATWGGCIEDRTQPNDTQDTTPVTTNFATLFPAERNCSNLASMMELSEDWTALHARIDSMNAAGNTNITIGLVWGWHALTGNQPFAGGVPPAPDREKAIVLLTDGDNTQNRWTTSRSSIDARTSLACANIKAANIRLYTIRVVNGNATLLRNCATNPTLYYDVQSAGQLSGVFSAIAQDLANLRLAR